VYLATGMGTVEKRKKEPEGREKGTSGKLDKPGSQKKGCGREAFNKQAKWGMFFEKKKNTTGCSLLEIAE